MTKRFISRVKTQGRSPGTLIHVGEKKVEHVEITQLVYSADQFAKTIFPHDPLITKLPANEILWINICGLHDLSLIEELSRHFALHPLTSEDIIQTDQRPRAQILDGYAYIVLRTVQWNENSEITAEQLSIVVGEQFVLTFQESQNHLLDNLMERVESNRGHLRKMGADFLGYAILDVVLDHYFDVLEQLGDYVGELEQEVLNRTDQSQLKEILELKQELLFFRNGARPLRELISEITTTESKFFTQTTRIYLRDLYDHSIQITEMSETVRELVLNVLELYLSSVSNKTNEVMRVLTVISTLFMPLTFMTSLYGMNFRFMPELDWSWSYPVLLLIMGVLTVLMMWYFRRKHWL